MATIITINRKLVKSSNITFKGHPLRMIQAKFGLNWPSGFRGEDFLKSLQMDNPLEYIAIKFDTYVIFFQNYG
jgi:hypothetical protein